MNKMIDIQKFFKDDNINQWNIIKTYLTDEEIQRIKTCQTLEQVQQLISQSISGLVDSAPETLDTLKELSAALNDDANFAATVTEQIANKVSKEDGKGLSSNDFTDEYKAKIENPTIKFVQVSW